MNKAWNQDPIFGEQPFKILKKLEVKIEGMKKREEAASLQYQLLVRPEIIRCHIEFSNKTATILFNPLDTKTEQILQAIPEPFSARIESEEELSYQKLLTSNFHL